MPRKKGLGRDVEKSIDTIDGLLVSLRDFEKIPLKRGLQSSKVLEKDLAKMINDASEKAHSLSLLIEDLKDAVKGIKTNKNSRFASKVVRKFLEQDL